MFCLKVGYDNLGLSIDFEFPAVATNEAKNKKAKAQITIPTPTEYKLPAKLENRLKSCGRKVNIYSRINIKIKPVDINTYLHHLVSL